MTQPIYPIASAEGLNLLVPDRSDPERDALAAAWIAHGGAVTRIGRFWDPPSVNPARVRVYGSDTFCLVLREKLGFELVTPDDDLLLRVPHSLLGRSVTSRVLGEAAQFEYPYFVKPMTPKLFHGRVYRDASDLAEECKGLPASTDVMRAEPVIFIAEARCFVLDCRVFDCAVYEGEGDPMAARECVDTVVREAALPRVVVVDVGLIQDGGWVVVEFNAAWGAGLNGCDAERVWPCVAAVSGPSLQ